MLSDIFGERTQGRYGLTWVFSINQHRPSVFQVKGYTGQAFPQFNFGYKLGMVSAHKPADGDNVKHTLMVGYDNQRPIVR